MHVFVLFCYHCTSQRIFSKEKKRKNLFWFIDTNLDICFIGETNRVATVLNLIVQGQAYPMLSSAERKYGRPDKFYQRFLKDLSLSFHGMLGEIYTNDMACFAQKLEVMSLIHKKEINHSLKTVD